MSFIKVSPGPVVIRGADVSNYQRSIDFNQFKASGKEFLQVKATEGHTIKDPIFQKHWTEAKAAGVIRGAYHFYHYIGDPIVQADFFTSTMGELSPGDMPCMLDVENADGRKALQSTDVAGVLACLNRIKENTGLTPWIYGGPYFLAICSHYGAFAEYPLVTAQYDSVAAIGLPWTTWTVWQYTNHGLIPGIGKIDSDIFNGTLEDLKARCKA